MSGLRAAAGGAALAWALACGSSEPEPAAQPPPATPRPEPPATQPSATEPGGEAGPGDAARGETLYATYCASCHGPRGDGDGPLASNLDPRPARHSDAAIMDALSDEYLFRVVKEGGAAVGKSPLMAPWGGTLSDAEIRDLVAFVRSLSRA
jgi:mono/diheme cytochrome c family protein